MRVRVRKILKVLIYFWINKSLGLTLCGMLFTPFCFAGRLFGKVHCFLCELSHFLRTKRNWILYMFSLVTDNVLFKRVYVFFLLDMWVVNIRSVGLGLCGLYMEFLFFHFKMFVVDLLWLLECCVKLVSIKK